ncbi:hypothetical protein [Aquibium oceanicum]|nr:hypothetical protein [Aquibium oceanicum]
MLITGLVIAVGLGAWARSAELGFVLLAAVVVAGSGFALTH